MTLEPLSINKLNFTFSQANHFSGCFLYILNQVISHLYAFFSIQFDTIAFQSLYALSKFAQYKWIYISRLKWTEGILNLPSKTRLFNNS